MTINEMFDELENNVRDTYIVTLKYKYDFEEKYTIENHILEYDSKADSYVWQNDWNEGQTDVEVLGYMLLGDIDTTKIEPCEDCISREAVRRILANQRDELVKLHTVNPKDNPKADAMAYGVNWSLNTLMELPSVKPSYNSIKIELEPCKDCVSREAVEKITWEEPSYDALNVLTEVRDKVKALPPVKPQRPKGKWLDKKMTIKGAHGMAYGRYACSVCKKKFPNKSNYCPNCGAETGGEEC